MATYKLTISYDGTRFSGWQVQPNGISVQALLQDAFNTVLREKIMITGAGRTDAGVHAHGQTAHFHFDKPLDLPKLQHSINALLPDDIRLMEIKEVSDDFHSRYSALSKEYHYQIDLTYNPFNRFYSWWVPYKIDIDLLKAALKKYEGEHDFKGFANENEKGVAAHDSKRRMIKCELIQNGAQLTIVYIADGFLYKMARNLTGTAIDIARGYLPLNTIDDIFDTQDRKKGGQAAPAHGLFLYKVNY